MALSDSSQMLFGASTLRMWPSSKAGMPTMVQPAGVVTPAFRVAHHVAIRQGLDDDGYEGGLVVQMSFTIESTNY